VTGTPETSSFGFGQNGRSIVLTHPYHVAVGQHAIEQSASIDARIDRNWLESDKWKVLALAAFSEAARGNATFQLVCGLPVAYYHDKDTVRDRLLGQHEFQRMGKNRRRQTVMVEKCTVMPQGFGVLFAECLNDSGRVADKTLQTGRAGILDVGGKTTNFLAANQLRMVDRESGSLEAGGWDVTTRVANYLASDYPDLTLTEYELIQHIRDRSIGYHGQTIDLSEIIRDASDALATRVIGYARRLWNGSARLDVILVAGGGAHLIGERLKAEFRQARIVENDPVFANALGYWRFAQAMK
jgi:plasmid segregation protein ParM